MRKITSILLTGCLLLSNTAIASAYDSGNIIEDIKPVPTLYQDPVPVLIQQPVPILIQAKVSVNPKEIKSESEELKINATIPVLEGLKDTGFQQQLNETIMSRAMDDIQKAKDDSEQFAQDCRENGWEVRANEIYINYEIKTIDQKDKNNIISFEVISYYNNGGTGMPNVDFYNVLNEKEARIIGLADLLGKNYKDIINPEICKQIEADIDKYFKDEFKTISDNQLFYLEQQDLVIVFDKYEIAPGCEGNPEFRMPLHYADDLLYIDQCKVELGENKIFAQEDGTVMIPLRVIAENLGYEVVWNGESNAIELTRGARWIMIKAGEDYYSFGKMAPMQLGTAAEVINDSTYVPINFVNDVLREKAIRNANGAISITTEAMSNLIDGAKNAAYTIEGDLFTLINGESDVEIVPGAASRIKTMVWGQPAIGDLNADGSNDLVMILTHQSGGSGTFYYAAVCLSDSQGGQYVGTNAIFLGDRIAPQNISIEKGTIIVNYADRGENESMATAPSIAVSKSLTVDGSTLKEI